MDQELERQIERAAEVLKSYGAKEVYVFGSAATGEMDEYSDIDFAVAGLPPGVFFRALAVASDAVGRHVDIIDLDSDNAFTRYLHSEGELKRVG